MAKITKEQYIKWSNQAKNGFNLDLQYFVTWGEKTLTKKVYHDGENVLQFKIEYSEEYEEKIHDYGCKWKVKTGRYIPMLYVSYWRPCASGYYRSGGWIENKQIGEPQTSKKYSVLCSLSETIDTDEFIKSLPPYIPDRLERLV